jgi:hypothetical protein
MQRSKLLCLLIFFNLIPGQLQAWDRDVHYLQGVYFAKYLISDEKRKTLGEELCEIGCPDITAAVRRGDYPHAFGLAAALPDKIRQWSSNSGVAVVADDHLTPKWANWPFASSFSASDTWKHHFVNITNSSEVSATSGVGDASFMQAAAFGDLITAIRFYEGVLQSKNSSKLERGYACAMLLHCLGDASQPFHANDASDKGGNDSFVVYFDAGTNFHSLWDGMILKQEAWGDRKAFCEYWEVKLHNAARRTPGLSVHEVLISGHAIGREARNCPTGYELPDGTRVKEGDVVPITKNLWQGEEYRSAFRDVAVERVALGAVFMGQRFERLLD